MLYAGVCFILPQGIIKSLMDISVAKEDLETMLSANQILESNLQSRKMLSNFFTALYLDNYFKYCKSRLC